MNFVQQKNSIFLGMFFLSLPLYGKELVTVSDAIPSICIDLKYATQDNIVHEALYESNFVCCVDSHIIDALKKAQEMLLQKGLCLRIWDAHQPLDMLKKIWNLLPDEKYITNPERGDSHTCGMAVDVTLVDLQKNCEVEMPTKFDCISIKSYAGCESVSEAACRNRELLKMVMLECGFEQPAQSPWWHFELKDWRSLS